MYKTHPQVDIKFITRKVDATHAYVAIPIFKPKHVARVVRDSKSILRTGFERHLNSMATRWNVRDIPVKPNMLQGGLEPEDLSDEERSIHQTRTLHPDGPTYMKPMHLYEYNIGSNSGLVSYMKQLYAERKETKSTGIRVVLCDCNIYWRIMKVLAQRHYAIFSFPFRTVTLRTRPFTVCAFSTLKIFFKPSNIFCL